MKSARTGKGLAPLFAVIALLGLMAAAVAFELHRNEKKERMKCLMNQRNIQQAYRGYSCCEGVLEGGRVDQEFIISKYLLEAPRCPSGGTYSWSAVVPPVGTLASPCSDPKHAPSPGTADDW